MNFYYFISKPLNTWPPRDKCDCAKDREMQTMQIKLPFPRLLSGSCQANRSQLQIAEIHQPI